VRPEPDRRVRRTRKALHDALLALMIEKGYDAVTVQDIIDRADVGRSTFYSHFTDKRDLLHSGLDDLRAMLGAPPAAGSDPAPVFRFSRAMLEHAHEQQRLARALIARADGGPVLAQLRLVIGEAVRAELTGRRGANPPDDLLVGYVVGAFLALMTGWLDTAPDMTPEQVDELFHTLVTPGLHAALA
jgi:AcrR family transcriptional regulator